MIGQAGKKKVEFVDKGLHVISTLYVGEGDFDFAYGIRTHEATPLRILLR